MSTSIHSVVKTLAPLLLVAVSAGSLWAMGQESFGPAGEHISRTSGWPRGIEDVLRHPSRVYWNWVNGNEHAYYDGDVGTINELIGRFAETGLAHHQVVILPGRPSARSFHGKLTPYAVEFHVPGGIYFHHVQQLARTGLYPTMPQLLVHVDDGLAARLNELKIPPGVTLRTQAHRAEDALAQIDARDRSLRSRAIAVLGDAGDASPQIMEALRRASEDGDEYIRNSAKRAVESIEESSKAKEGTLRRRIAQFLQNHRQRQRIPEPEELLDTLHRTDATYGKGFTASGTMIRPTLSGRGQLVAWTVTMGEDQVVLQERAVEDDNHPRTEGRQETTMYIGQDSMGVVRRERLWINGQLTDTSPHASFEKPGSTYDLLLGRVLWPLGRGFSRRLDRVVDVTAAADGTLIVKAECDKTGMNWRWELRIDPHADYLVCSAKAFLRDQSTPSYVLSNNGRMTAGDRCVGHIAEWVEGPWAHPISISVDSVSGEPDLDLIRRAKSSLAQRSD